MPLTKQTFTADIFGETYQFRPDPGVSNNLWIIRRLNQSVGELLDQRRVIFPKRRMTHQQMIAWYAERLVFDRAEADRRADERAWHEYNPEAS